MKAKRLKIPEDQVDLTPMIDIVFLLLIYFMVTTTIVQEEADLGVKLPSSVAAPPDTPLPEQHYIDILLDGTVLLNGVPTDNPGSTDLPNLTRTLNQLKLSSDRAGLKTLVIIQPDPETFQQSVVNVLNALKAVGINSISFGEGG
jgi:biopolymer transport protein ExbD